MQIISCFINSRFLLFNLILYSSCPIVTVLETIPETEETIAEIAVTETVGVSIEIIVGTMNTDVSQTIVIADLQAVKEAAAVKEMAVDVLEELAVIVAKDMRAKNQQFQVLNFSSLFPFSKLIFLV